jgi:hypothetical protein
LVEWLNGPVVAKQAAAGQLVNFPISKTQQTIVVPPVHARPMPFGHQIIFSFLPFSHFL